MQIPAFLYGIYQDVKSQCRKKVTALIRGTAWEDLWTSDLLETSMHPGLIVLHGPSPTLGSSAQFHVYVLHLLIRDAYLSGRLAAEIEERLFEASLQTAWSTLGLLAHANQMWIYQPTRHEPLLRASLQFWNELMQEDDRYSSGSATGTNLWNLHTSLKYILANMNVPADILNTPLSEGGLETIVEEFKPN